MSKEYEITVKLKGRAESKEEALEGCRLRLVSVGLSNFQITKVVEKESEAEKYRKIYHY